MTRASGRNTKNTDTKPDAPVASASRGKRKNPDTSEASDRPAKKLSKKKGKKDEDEGTARVTAETSDHTVWSTRDEAELVTLLLEIKCSSGDSEGATFKSSVWSTVASQLADSTTAGGEKTAKACKNKYQKVCTCMSSLFYLHASSNIEWYFFYSSRRPTGW